ncbi:MAG: hypothetical protein BGO38_13935 [Cellulomonas sp. 73-145]|uniref:FAD:protein FMN transferase n=1 Tax=Cellulomonas sp. 73-145 TaxID=1895739 RepID=UPI000929692B|nr:FAD:protein FMN transferase [Cellulomonas sp. 73-145]MBN9326292.1 FAD:protein FMN transferase [Cellulomonas sp.]OJV59846.1 MAG: hypothetical protein BGO38_13935 [Cellulomonas sp. 73-145]
MTAGTRSRELSTTFRSMASDVELRVVDPGPDAPRAVEAARVAIRSVATHLTRFEATSALSRLNARPSSWHVVPEELAEAVEEAERAHRMTGGLFDPRVLDQLLAWGYDRTFDEVVGSTRGTTASTGPTASTRAVGSTGAVGPTGAVGSAGSAGTPGPRGTRRPWRPTVLPGTDRRLVQLDGAPIDLGGIGKGLAVRRAARALVGAGSAVLVDAGGDEWLGGAGPDGNGWTVGVEDPHGGADPVLVLSVTDRGCATSSVRRRHWAAPDGTSVHHLVDPRTGRPGGPGLAAVTVLHPDPMWAEVWSKTLFLAGVVEVEAQAHVRELAAAWVTDSGAVRVSAAMEPYVVWRAA